MGRLFKWFSAYFIRGLLLFFPLLIVMLLFGWVYGKLDRFAEWVMPSLQYSGFRVGLLILAMFFLFAGFGHFATTVFARPLRRYLIRLLDKAPLVKTIYNSLRDLLDAFVGNKKKFNQPVLVKLTKDTQVEKLGFITKQDLSEFGIEGKVAVYLPHSFNFSGNLFIVPKDCVTPVKANSSEVMKFIVSGGISDK